MGLHTRTANLRLSRGRISISSRHQRRPAAMEPSQEQPTRSIEVSLALLVSILPLPLSVSVEGSSGSRRCQQRQNFTVADLTAAELSL